MIQTQVTSDPAVPFLSCLPYSGIRGGAYLSARMAVGSWSGL